MSILRTTLVGGALGAALTLAACGGGSGTAATGTGTGGATGSGSTGTGTFAPGPHPAQPQILNPAPAGPVLKSPRVQPIVYASDPGLADMQGFLTELTKTSFWGEATLEYGVGTLSLKPAIMRTEMPPTSVSDYSLQMDLVQNLQGTSPAWGAVDEGAIYLFLLPPGTIETDPSGSCCTDFDGYHYETAIGASTVAYAVVCACPGFDGKNITDVQQRTVAISHELVESATDPFLTGYGQPDEDDLVWFLTTGGEVSDMCEFNTDSYDTPPGSTYMIQRTWSNAAAAAGHNPCVPAPAAPYFSSMPVLPDMVSFNDTMDQLSAMTKGVKIPVGQSKTIDVQLFSDAPTSGPWNVKAVDYSCAMQPPPCTPKLDLSLDKSTGQNGDTLHLTITVKAADPNFGAEAFVIFSDLNGQNNLAMGLVGN